MSGPKPLDRVEQVASHILADAGLVIVDVGAARGLPWHLSALRNIASIVCCFEPDPEAAERLNREASEGGQTNLKVFPVALASSEAERTISNLTTAASNMIGNRLQQLSDSIKNETMEAERLLTTVSASTSGAIKSSAHDAERLLSGMSTGVSNVLKQNAGEV